MFVCTGKGVSGCTPIPYPKAVGSRSSPSSLPQPWERRVGEPEHWARSQRRTMLGSSCLLISNEGVWSDHLCPGLARDWRTSPLSCQARVPTLIQCTANACFHTAMVELDGDDVRISSRGKLAERDIVQVKPKSCLSHGKCPSPSSQANLIPPFRKFSGKGPWRELQGGLVTKEGNRNQSLGHTCPLAGPLPTMSETCPQCFCPDRNGLPRPP